MKYQRCAVGILALLVMAAAPPENESVWSRIVAGTSRLVRNPFRRAEMAPQGTPARDEGQASQLPARTPNQPSRGNVQRDERVRPATAVTPAPKPAAAGEPRRSPWAGLFSRSKRPPSRSISEYMAQEKP